MLCDERLDAIGAVVPAGNVEHPEPVTLCHACAVLPSDERKPLRDQAMTRMLQSDSE